MLSITKLTCPSSLSPADIRLTLAISASGVIVSMSSVLFCTNKDEHPFELITDTVFLTCHFVSRKFMLRKKR